MLNSVLLRLREKEGFLTQYLDGMSKLWISGIIGFLQERARPNVQVKENDPSNINAIALEAARSAGYFQCIEDLMYFKELYLDEPKSKNDVPMDFGAIDIALAKGDLLKEEADAIRSGEPIDYQAIISSDNNTR